MLMIAIKFRRETIPFSEIKRGDIFQKPCETDWCRATTSATFNEKDKVYGCEVWRSLDWLLDDDKEILKLYDRGNIAEAVCGVFDSQISGGKRYDLAVRGRNLANATFFESHEVDKHPQLSFAMDLTPLVEDPALNVADYTLGLLRRTEDDVVDRIKRMTST